MVEIVGTKSTSNNWGNMLSVSSLDSNCVADMSENLVVAQANEGKLGKVGVCRIVFECVQLTRSDL